MTMHMSATDGTQAESDRVHECLANGDSTFNELPIAPNGRVACPECDSETFLESEGKEPARFQCQNKHEFFTESQLVVYANLLDLRIIVHSDSVQSHGAG